MAVAGTLATLGLTAIPAQASGFVDVFNEQDVLAHPWFKSNCWGFGVPAGSTGWVFFGGIGARGRFGWDFKDPALTNPACAKPVIQFTYTPDLTPPPDRLPSNQRAKFKFGNDRNTVIQIGDHIQSIGLGPHADESDDD
jgi:hypothetical protein